MIETAREAVFALGAHPLRRARLAVLSVAIAMAACASKPQAPVPAPKVEGLPELMHRAATAQASGDREKARELYRSAAKAEPTSKAPWLKLAEGYFESGDYGNAVLAAQEVIHRDASDSVAAGRCASRQTENERQHDEAVAGKRDAYTRKSGWRGRWRLRVHEACGSWSRELLRCAMEVRC